LPRDTFELIGTGSKRDMVKEHRVGDLMQDAQASLAHLLRHKDLKSNQWLLRLSSGGRTGNWEPLTTDSNENAAIIKNKIARSITPVTDLVLAFVGMVEWRGTKSLMSHMQYFRTGYNEGLLYGAHLIHDDSGHKFRRRGSFLIMGTCRNSWLVE
jgi:hypothetical protein